MDPTEEATMEWMVMNMDRFFSPNLQLGSFVGENKYHVNHKCYAKLEEILNRLNQDKSRWHFRRSLFMNKIVSQNLLPNLIYAKEDRRLMGATIKVLQELMTPVECLMPVQTMSQSGEGQRIVQELERAISSAKKLFLDTRVTKALVDFVDDILQQPKAMSISDCEMVNHCLILVRNLFHVQPQSTPAPGDSKASSSAHSDGTPSKKECKSEKSFHSNASAKSEAASNASASQKSYNSQSSSQIVLTEDQIMWNLFAQRFDSILIKLLTCQQQHLWNITMVQLVSLMYREQQQGTIRNLINEWLELSLCESSTDDENNTLSSSSYDAVSTSDPVSDSSERLSPVEGARCPKSKPSVGGGTCNSDKNSSMSSQCMNSSSKDSGIGRSSNNEGETSVDESILEWTLPTHAKRKEGGKGSKHQTHLESETKTEEEEKCVHPTVEWMQDDIKRIHLEESAMDLETFSKDTLQDIRCVFDEAEQEWSTPDKQQNSNKGISTPDEEKEHLIMTTDATSMAKPKKESAKKPPDENESYSGDSSEKPPPHPLPKLVKGKVLLPGQKRSRHCMSQKMMSETQEMQELSNSTGSDCDEGPHAKRPLHQKPHKMLVKPRPSKLLQKAMQERNMKRTKLLKRKESSGIKAKALLHHQPTPEDISNLLKEFTLDFMLNGYATLVQGLRMQVLLPYQVDLDKSHLLWLITYFLRFAVELDLELSQICPVLSVDVVSYLVYEGVVMQEELEIAIRNGEGNLISHVRRLHLVVTALREFFISFDVCLKKDPSTIDSRQLSTIKDDISQLVELRQIFVFLIRTYRPGILTLNYLQDLITTNHRFLITQESSHLSQSPFDMICHIKQFATMDIMHQYGRVLENFNDNDEMVNDCIFTMMHHISGELRAVNVLLQPSILKVFLRIWKEGFELCVDWADLIEYVLRKCTKKRTENHVALDRISIGEAQEIQLTAEDLDQMYTLYSTFNEQDLLEKIKDVCCDDSIEEPIKKEVIQKLLARGYISSTECTKLCAEIPQSEPIYKDHISSNKRSFDRIDNGASQKKELTWDSANFTDSMTSVCHHELREENFAEMEDHNAKRFCPNQEEPKDHFLTGLSIFDYDYKMEAESVKTTTSSAEATFNTDFDYKEEMEDSLAEKSLIASIIDQIHQEGYGNQLRWLQSEILEACYAKLKLISPSLPLPEPLPFHFAISNQSIPIIPWTSEQETAIASPAFRQLFNLLGIHLPTESGKIYPRIPHFWDPDVLFDVTQRLGPVNQESLKFSLALMTEMLQQLTSMKLSSLEHQESFDDNYNRCDEICDFNSFDCDDSPERVSDCSMQNNRSTSTSPVSSLEDDFPPLQRDIRLPYSLDMPHSPLSVECTKGSPISVITEEDEEELEEQLHLERDEALDEQDEILTSDLPRFHSDSEMTELQSDQFPPVFERDLKPS